MKQQQPVPRGWAGVDVGKGHHWVCLIDEAGTALWSSRVANDEGAILEAIGVVLARAQQVRWAVDVTGTMSALLLALLAAHGQRVTYVPGRTVNRMTVAYQGEAKTDARDAYVIAETVRHRGDLHEVDVPTALVSELRLLVAHRSDLVADRVRIINRLRDVLTGYFPALERAFDFAHSRGAVVLLTGYQTPAAIRARGQSRLQAWLARRKVRSAAQIAADALAAAQTQHTSVPAEAVAASIVADLATQLLAIDARISDLPIPPASRDHRVSAGHGADPGRRAHRGRRGPERLPGRGPPGLCRRTGARAP
jgi:transposase